ncbi:MAG: DUF6434 domain-containing protein [Pseudomonadota bacterium]
MTKETRPDLDALTDAAVFRDWYWLKEELVAYCRAQGLSMAGSKAELTDRIAAHMDGAAAPRRARRKVSSGVNWAHLVITRDTVITDSYTNGPNTRAFFKGEIGARFTFNIAFMDWMRSHVGRTMGEAVEAWLEIEAEKKAGKRAAIPPSNQFNAYVRAFFDANPGCSMDEARACWAHKRGLPGPNSYDPEDLAALTP